MSEQKLKMEAEMLDGFTIVKHSWVQALCKRRLKREEEWMEASV